MPPTPFCPVCLSQTIHWPTLSGGATLYSYSVVTRAVVPGMDEYLPYAPAVVELDGGGGARLISNVAACTLDALHVGMRLAPRLRDAAVDRKSVVSGESVSVRVALGVRRVMKQKNRLTRSHQPK